MRAIHVNLDFCAFGLKLKQFLANVHAFSLVPTTEWIDMFVCFLTPAFAQ